MWRAVVKIEPLDGRQPRVLAARGGGMKARRLSPGDTIGVVSPSWGGPAAFPHRLDNAVAYLESRGFNVRVAPNARGSAGFVSGTPEERAFDIHEMFADPDIAAIIASAGGDHSCHLLPLLDFDLIAANPKVVMGYSDITVLNVAIWKRTGLVTFNGPAMMTDFAEYPHPLDYTMRYFDRAICASEPIGRIEASAAWTEEFLDWRTKTDLTRGRRMSDSPGWSWVRGGVAVGELVGGCISSLQHLRGTSFWPTFEGRILFLETSESKPSPARVDGILMDYQNMGVFDVLQGLLVGRPMNYSDSEKAELREVVRRRTAPYSFPVVTDMDFGHTAPQFTLPIGCRARIDASAQSFEILEAAVV